MMSNHNLSWPVLWGITIFMIFISSCINLKTTPLQKQKFVLNVTRAGDKIPEIKNSILKFRRFTISSKFAGSGLVYRTDDLNYDSDFYNVFFAPPELIITEQSQQWLSKSGMFTSVVDMGSLVDANFILEANISNLYGDYRNDNVPKAVIEIQIFLIERSMNIKSIAFSKIYKMATPIESASPKALIGGLNKSLEQILQTLEKDLQRTLESRK